MNPKKQLAIRLRRSGQSYNEICRTLKIPKSTLSYWLKDLPLSKIERGRLLTRNQQQWAESITRYNQWRAREAKLRTQNDISTAAAQIGNLSAKELRLVGSALYWAEGNKMDRWRFRFSNTDPAMIHLMVQFLQKVCHIPSTKLSAQVHLHPNISETRAKHFWSQASGIPLHRFIRSQHALSRSSNGKRPAHRLPYGTFHLAAQNVKVRNQVVGWIEGLRKSFSGSH